MSNAECLLVCTHACIPLVDVNRPMCSYVESFTIATSRYAICVHIELRLWMVVGWVVLVLYGSVVSFVPGSVSSSPHKSLGMRLLTCTQTAFINQETISTIMHLHTRTEELEGVCGIHPHLFNKLLAIIKHGSFSDIGLNILFAPALNPLVYIQHDR